MSTYLLAFVVGRFDIIEDHVESVKVRVLAPPGRAERGRYALETATRTLRLETLFIVGLEMIRVTLLV